MSSKKKKDDSIKISPASYWEWRCTIEELKTSKLNEKRVHLEREIMNKEIENRKLRLALFKETVTSAQKSVQNCSEELGKIKQRLESEIGTSLENCSIDPYTYEVKKIEEHKK